MKIFYPNGVGETLPVILDLIHGNPGYEKYIMQMAKAAYYFKEQRRLFHIMKREFPELSALILDNITEFEDVGIILILDSGKKITKDFRPDEVGHGLDNELEREVREMLQIEQLNAAGNKINLGVFQGMEKGDRFISANGEEIEYRGYDEIEGMITIRARAVSNNEALEYETNGACCGGPCSALGKFDFHSRLQNKNLTE